MTDAADHRKNGPFGFGRIFGNFLILCSLAALVIGVGNLTQQRQDLSRQRLILDCQTRYNEAYAAAISERTKAAGSDRRAIRDMITTVSALGSAPVSERRRLYSAALADFLRRSQDADRQRNANPLPNPRCP